MNFFGSHKNNHFQVIKSQKHELNLGNVKKVSKKKSTYFLQANNLEKILFLANSKTQSLKIFLNQNN